LQFVGIPLLAAAGLGWTRLPEKYGWQVFLTLLVPLILLALFVLMQAATARRLIGAEEGRVRLVWGALSWLVWILLLWFAWWVLDWWDANDYSWASYLNSLAPATWRARVFTYAHLHSWMDGIEWVLRWIVVPGKLTLCAAASSQWGWRLKWRRLVRVLLSWRWWPAVTVAALLAVRLPEHWFAAEPKGTVHAQVWAVGLKIAATWVLGVLWWVLLLAWAAVLMVRQKEPAADAVDALIGAKLWRARWAVLALLVWVVAWTELPYVSGLPPAWAWTGGLFVGAVCLALVVLQVFLMRALITAEEKRSGVVWGLLSLLAWGVVGLVIAVLVSLYAHSMVAIALCWVIGPAVLVPFAMASAQWGFRLPWGRVLRIVGAWKWWVGVVLAAILGAGLPAMLLVVTSNGDDALKGLAAWVVRLIANLISAAVWVVLLGWLAVLFGRQNPPKEEVMVREPVGVGPKEDVRRAKADLPEPEPGE
jgi:hypothetical protein